MVGEVMELFKNIFATCLAWFWQTLEAIDGLDWVLAALIFVVVVSLLLMPLRGGRSIDTSPIRETVRGTFRSVNAKKERSRNE